MASTEAQAAYADLKNSGLVPITKELEEKPDGSSDFSCLLPVPGPNKEGLPDRVEMVVRLPAHFPYGKVSFIPVGPDVQGFPHQASPRFGSELCLMSERSYPWEPSARLRSYVEGAIKWLADAATGNLLEAGQPWELPDFRLPESERPKAKPVVFVESSDSFGHWSRLLGKSGGADLADYYSRRSVIPISFSLGGQACRRPQESA